MLDLDQASRRLWAPFWPAIAGFVLVGLVFAAWLLRAAPESGIAAAPVTSVSPERLSGELTVWSWNIAAKSLQRLVPAFERRAPHVKVDVDMTGAQMQTRLMLSLAAGVGAPDVSQLQLTDAPHYIATERLADLSPVAEKYRALFPASVWDNCLLRGRVYAIPWDVGPCAVFYRRDLFRKYGVDPEKIDTWDDY